MPQAFMTSPTDQMGSKDSTVHGGTSSYVSATNTVGGLLSVLMYRSRAIDTKEI